MVAHIPRIFLFQRTHVQSTFHPAKTGFLVLRIPREDMGAQFDPSKGVVSTVKDTLQKIDITGAPPISVASVIASNGGTWSRDGVILFGTGATRVLYRVSAAGGEVAPLMKRETTTGYGAPYFFPDGNRYLYEGTQTKTGGVYLSSLDSDTSRLLVRGGTRPVYQQGRLLYLLGTTLISQPFDEKRLEIVGEASALAEEAQFFSASQTGAVLAYWTGSAENLPQLIWFDRSGNLIGKLGDPVSQFNIRLSPDSTRVAAEIHDPQVGVTNSDIWLYDVVRGVRSRFTSGPGSARVPCWSPDGKKIVFSSDRKGHFDLYEKATDGTGDEKPVLESQDAKYCESWSPDGKFILYITFSTNTSHHPETRKEARRPPCPRGNGASENRKSGATGGLCL
jgi:Tol biopolymer transport system component